MEWNVLERIDEDAARERLAPFDSHFQRADPVFGAEVEPMVLSESVALLLPSGSYGHITLPPRSGGIFVEGDLVINGVLEQPFRSAPLFVSGNLEATHLVTCGCLVVLGSLELDGVVYGNCTNYCTHVFGDVRARSIILEKNHHFAVHGSVTSGERIDDEEGGYEATEEWMGKRGVEAHDETGLAQALRAS